MVQALPWPRSISAPRTSKSPRLKSYYSYSSSSTYTSVRKAVLKHKKLFTKGDIFFVTGSSKAQYLLPTSFILWTCASMRFLIGNLSKISWNILNCYFKWKQCVPHWVKFCIQCQKYMTSVLMMMIRLMAWRIHHGECICHFLCLLLLLRVYWKHAQWQEILRLFTTHSLQKGSCHWNNKAK